jgi:hypothetical protein
MHQVLIRISFISLTCHILSLSHLPWFKKYLKLGTLKSHCHVNSWKLQNLYSVRKAHNFIRLEIILNIISVLVICERKELKLNWPRNFWYIYLLNSKFWAKNGV